MSETIWWDAVATAEAIRHGRVTAVDLVLETLARIDTFDGDLRSYVAVDRERCLASARSADKLLERSGPADAPPFLGVPLSIKDVIDVAGLPTTHSCKALADNVASADAPLVGRFRDAGFVIMGKTNVPEFCTSMTTSELHGICRNPWDRERTAGGSSGGAAAAVAAGLCTVAHGTDGAGSVRGPASFCGLVGLKPTRGLIAFGPEVEAPYFGPSEHGVLTRSVRDAAALLDVMVGPPEQRWSPRQEQTYERLAAEESPRLRVAVTNVAPYGEVSQECAAVVEHIADVLRSLGHTVAHATPDWMSILKVSAGSVTVPAPAGLIPADKHHLVEPRNRRLLDRLTTMTVLEHSQWVAEARAATRSFLAFWEDYDVLLSATHGIVAPSVSWAPWDQTAEQHGATFMRFPNFAQPFNISGQPALNVPAATNSDGLPIGVHLAGRHLEEATLLRLAAEIERALPPPDRIPRAFA